MVRVRILGICVLMLVTGSSFAQEHEHRSSEKLGAVHFATSCNEGAQKEFDRAVALLHSFQFSKAIQGFRATLKNDETCGIAYWGSTLSQWSNPFAAGMKDSGQLQAGRESAELGKTTGAKTERERAYLAAVATLYNDFENTPQRVRLLAYRDAMSEVAAKYPTDHEAQIFYALAIAASEDPSDKTYAGRLKAGAILDKLFEEEPNHPGLAHYIIHTYDVPPLAPRALAAARRYSEIAPDAPHALHMPSHTFTRTGYWQDSIDSNVAAAAAAKREGQTAEELHASDYLTYAYLCLPANRAGRCGAKGAEFVAGNRIALRSQNSDRRCRRPLGGILRAGCDPSTVCTGTRGLEAGSAAYSTRDALSLYRGHDLVRGLGSARMGQAPAAYESATSLKQIRERLLKSGENYWGQQVEIQELEIRAWAMLAEGKKEEALRQMESAAELEDGMEKSAVTPGPLAPARELLGEMLLATNQPAPALAQFEATLKKEPGRFRALYEAGHAALLSGNGEASQTYFRELLKVCEHADKPGRAELQEAGKAVSQN